MEELKNELEKIIGKELQRANEKYPLFASDHEGYAVAKEEQEEAKEALSRSGTHLFFMWCDGVRKDNSQVTALKATSAYEDAVNAAAETIQYAAMCLKVILSQEKRGEK